MLAITFLQPATQGGKPSIQVPVPLESFDKHPHAKQKKN